MWKEHMIREHPTTEVGQLLKEENEYISKHKKQKSSEPSSLDDFKFDTSIFNPSIFNFNDQK